MIPDPDGAFVGSTIQTTETVETPISTSSHNNGSDVHALRVNAVQQGLNSLGYGMSLTQDRDALNQVVGAASVGVYILSLFSKTVARYNPITGGILATYTAWDIYDSNFSDHTGRKALIGQ